MLKNKSNFSVCRFRFISPRTQKSPPLTHPGSQPEKDTSSSRLSTGDNHSLSLYHTNKNSLSQLSNSKLPRILYNIVSKSTNPLSLPPPLHTSHQLFVFIVTTNNYHFLLRLLLNHKHGWESRAYGRTGSCT